MQFLQWLRNLLAGFSSSSESEDLGPVSENERIARFIFSSSHYAKTKNAVKYAAYMPARNGESSVYRTDGLADEDVWSIGDNYVAPDRGKAILARADIESDRVVATSLELSPEPSPHFRHANIESWPTRKSEQKLLALELAQASTLHIK